MGSVQARGALDAVVAAAARRRHLEAALRAALEERGYAEVAVPLLQPAAAGLDWEAAYRVLDQDGRVLDLRPDLTGPVARLCAIGDAGGPRPRRLHYQAAIFRRDPGEGPREIHQAGAERIGGAGDPAAIVAADAEILATVANCLARAGAQRPLLAVGHAGYARERLAAAGADVERAFGALRRRALADLPALAGAQAAGELLWRGDLAAAGRGGIVGEGPQAAAFRALAGCLLAADLADRVVVEPALALPGLYYTGLVFEILLPGVPGPIGDGGRYDQLLGRWGPTEPAVGFALDCDRLLAALEGDGLAEEARRAWAAVGLAGGERR